MKAPKPKNVAPSRSANMAKVRSKNTQPEWRVRKLVHSMGFRYRLYVKNLPGQPDLVFASRRKAIFVHGCFWHQHNDGCCKRSALPASNLEFWKEKLERNVERDASNIARLDQLGWHVLIVWECETKVRSVNILRQKVLRFLGQ